MIDEIFAALSDSGKRIAIAQDVKEQLRLKKLVASTGTYFRLRNYYGGEEVQLQDVIAKKQVVCEACIRGALFLSDVMKLNDYTVENTYEEGWGTWPERINAKVSYFSQSQQELMEVAFEGSANFADRDVYTGQLTEEGRRAMDFHSDYGDDEDRMIAIVDNVIENNGEFKP